MTGSNRIHAHFSGNEIRNLSLFPPLELIVVKSENKKKEVEK